MKFVLISAPGKLMGEHPTLLEFLNGDLKTYHIRKPNSSKQEVQNMLNMIYKKDRKKIVLHGYPDLVKKYELKGIHHNSTSEYIPNFGDEFTQSKSFHSIEDIAKDNNPYDYVFLSPIYDSISKEGYKSNFDLNDLKLPSNQNIIALGGVTPDKIPALKNAGFYGVAALGSIWNTILYPKMMKVYNDFITQCD